MAHVLEHLSSKGEVLHSIPSTTTKKKKKLDTHSMWYKPQNIKYNKVIETTGYFSYGITKILIEF
jgi:hypothetical protein